MANDRRVLHDLVSAVYRGGYLIELEFDDGQCGVVDFEGYLERRGVFERFRDLEYFRTFTVNKELGVLTWGDEIDIAPETLYAEATGTDLPNWMNPDGPPVLSKRQAQAAATVRSSVSNSRSQ